METVEDAYEELAKGILDFIKNRPWDSGVCKCQIYQKMASISCWLVKEGILNPSGLDWPDRTIDKGGAALFLRDNIRATTGDRIWGLTFTLYPDGKFNIEYQ